ncbi:type IV pilin [Halorubrum sp. SD626R]|uniref:type IV pilin n=1 Tax=Halorubrum sp. SD626R TaxID=1419722 RepID=UPI000B0587EC|nr:type IV pilin N-terminal domain-containing protein [Halorubrum sp. SD626R]TKX80274.1 type IV pilin [Halorubrum sp. SD626R]
MNFETAFQGEDRAVSPVIGVILMVAITVILAAVIGTFVLGLGDQLGDSTPQASYGIDNVDSGTDQIEITKTGGQDLAFDDLRVVVDVEGNTSEFDLASLSSPAGDEWRTADTAVIDASGSTTILTVRGSGDLDATPDGIDSIDAGNDVTVTIIYKPSGGPVAEATASA